MRKLGRGERNRTDQQTPLYYATVNGLPQGAGEGVGQIDKKAFIALPTTLRVGDHFFILITNLPILH